MPHNTVAVVGAAETTEMGVITNLSLRPGDYVSAGKAELALVDTDSLRVEGYFEETKLSRIHVGDAV